MRHPDMLENCLGTLPCKANTLVPHPYNPHSNRQAHTPDSATRLIPRLISKSARAVNRKQHRTSKHNQPRRRLRKFELLSKLVWEDPLSCMEVLSEIGTASRIIGMFTSPAHRSMAIR